MNDTSAHIARLLRERYARLTGAQRLLMGASMFDAARTMTIASFPKDLPVYEIRRRQP